MKNKAQTEKKPAEHYRQRDTQRSYGRRKGKKLSKGQADAWERLLPLVRIDIPESGVIDVEALCHAERSEASPSKPVIPAQAGIQLSSGVGGEMDSRLRGNDDVTGAMPEDRLVTTSPRTIPREGCAPPARKKIYLEIGFGAGEHLVGVAKQYPDVLFIGCEPFMNGAAQCLVLMEAQGVTNIRIFPDDAQLLLDALPDGCIARTDILFPDPWRKKAHHKRRIVNPVTLKKLARLMARGVELRLATDHTDYAAWMLEQIALCEDFAWMAASQDDFQQPPEDWVVTRYQEKALREGREAVFVGCVKV